MACLRRKIVSSVLVLAIMFTQVVSAPVAVAFSFGFGAQAAVAEAAGGGAANVEAANPPKNPETLYDLVAMVVDMDIDQDDNSYFGLKDDYDGQFVGSLGENKLGGRVLRYAEDIRNNNKLTDVKIIFYDKNKDDVLSLAEALENLYKSGDGSNNNRLSGVVLVGDIPLPVVNKNGNRFISMFPYSDFSDKAYVYSQSTRSFERNNDVTFPKPEVWHGIMRAPNNNVAGKELLAEFFDKNHLYYVGEPMFAEFDRKMFFGDLIHEEEQINSEIYKRYIDYLDSLEDFAYSRFNKFWASELMSDITSDLEFNEDNPMNQEQVVNGEVVPGFADTIKSGDFLASMPDILAKGIIEKNLLQYYEVLNRYIASANDWADYTGRYKTSDVHTVPALISMKDEYAKFYLKAVNDALESKVNEVVEKLQEPLPLLNYSKLSGEFQVRNDAGKILSKDKFEVTINNGILPVEISEDVYFRYHYRPNIVGEPLYVNGIKADLIESPKQCSPYLGSTKSEYFNEDLNFAPNVAGGDKYSILTRSLRSDNVLTSMPVATSGVNTRLLTPEELIAKTNNAYAGNVDAGGVKATGAIIESIPEYGIPAFLHNPLYSAASKYKGPFEKELKEGDVIVKVNKKNISYAYTFEQATQQSFKAVQNVIDLNNQDKITALNNYPYPIKRLPGESFGQGTMNKAVGFMSVEFYRQGNLNKRYFSFTVGKDGVTSTADPQGDPEVFVLLDTPPGIDFDNADYYDDYNHANRGAIFTLYQNRDHGYNGKPYDNSAGCNAASTLQNSDRCLPLAATMPVLDPVGSLAPVKMEIPGGDARLMFPEKVKRTLKGENSGRAADYQTNVELFQFPESFKYEDVDRVYLNSCYTGYPSTPADFSNNNFDFVLDTSTESALPDPDYDLDLYGKLLKKFGEFVAGSLANDPDYVEGDSLANESNFNPKSSIWGGLSESDASQVILNKGNLGLDPVVTLKDFSDHYGLFDGVDNDGDGVVDYEWRDNDNDGVFETQFFDFEEANPAYGIPSWNVEEIARKMLSHEAVYVVPFGFSSFPYDKFDEDIVLKVQPGVEKEISSMIVHNEPTDYTLSQQFASNTAFSLPIDNPRYVYFQSRPKAGASYPPPQPVNEFVNVEAITENLYTSTLYYPGDEHRVDYVNLFAEDVANPAHLQVKLSLKADELALIPGSYRIFGPGAKEGDYTLVEVKNKILDDYFLPAVSGVTDDPPGAFELKSASGKKVYDAMNWKSLNIDEKHEYVLLNYLNPSKNAYVNDVTNFPKPPGELEAGFGYESAYLVLDGDKNYFDMHFNKDLPEDGDAAFDPLAIAVGAEGGGAADEADAAGAGGGGGAGDEDFEFVALSEFLKEIKKFIDSFTTVPEFVNACAYSEEAGEDFGDEGTEAGLVKQPLANLEIGVSQTTVGAKAGAKYSVLVSALTADGSSYADDGLVKLNVNQDADSPPFNLADSPEKALVDGSAVFNLVTTGNQGSVILSASGPEGVDADARQIIVTGNELRLFSYTYSELEGFDELEAAIEAGEEVVGGGEGDGEGGGGGEGGEGDSYDEDSISTSNVGDDLGEIISVLEEEVDSGVSGADSITGDESGEGDGVEGESEEVSGADFITGDESGGSEGGDGSGGDGGGDGGENSITGDEDGDGGSVDFDGESGGESGSGGGDSSDSDLAGADSITGDETVDGDSADEGEGANLNWEKYFIQNQYYKKFRGPKLESGRRRLLAALDAKNPFIDADKNDESRYIVQPGNAFVADGKSLMKISVQVFNQDGELQTDLHRKVRFSVKDVSVGLAPDKIVSFENGNKADLVNGAATVYLRAGTKTGQFILEAQLLKSDGVTVDSAFAPVVDELFLEAGAPAFVEIKADSYALAANNKSKTRVNFILKDKYGNVAENAFNLISVFSDNIVKIDESVDLNKKIPGAQLATFDGGAGVDLLAKDKTGSAKVIVVLMDYELEEILLDSDIGDVDFNNYIGNSKTFDVFDKVSLEATVLDENFDKVTSIEADGESIARLGVRLLHDGKVVDQYSGPINFSIPNENFGRFAAQPAGKMSFGELNPANVTFKSSTLAGNVEVLVDVPGFSSDTIKFKTVAGAPKKIKLGSSKDYVNTDSNDSVVLQAELLDANDNLVEGNTGTVTNFKATEATKNLVTFSAANAVSLNGRAATQLKGKDISGSVNLSASAGDLEVGTLSLDINKRVGSSTVGDFNPRSLYVSLLGGAFGNIRSKNNLAQTMLYSGQVEAVSAVSASPEDKQRLLSLDAYGQIRILSDNAELSIAPATDSFPYQKISVSDVLEKKELAEMFMVPKVDTPLILIGENADLLGDGIYVRNMVEEDKSLNFEEADDGVYVKSDGATKVKIDKFGRISIDDPLFKLVLDGEAGSGDLVFSVEKAQEPVAKVIFRQKFNKNLQQIDYDSNVAQFTPGIYVKLKSASQTYDFIPAFSRISSADYMGAYLVNTEENIDAAQAPGASFASLEKARDTFGLGFEGDNKHMLLFSAGNSVGESNIPYASEAGMIFGDPMIRLDVDEELISGGTGYGKDIGKPIFTGEEEILKMVEFDFNGDGYDDLLLAYEDGLVRLLENKISNKRFIDRGYVLNIVNGILSFTKIDVNNDGFDDLLVGTKDGCKANEQCLSLFTNKDGHFVRKSLDLSLNGKKVYEVKAADMNADGCQDIILSDSAGDIAIHYNKIDDAKCAGPENNRGNTWNFGFSVNPNANQADNIFVNYPGMEQPNDNNYFKFVEFVLQSSTPEVEATGFAADAQDFQAGILSNPNIAGKEVPPLSYPKKYNFIHLKQDARLIQSTKTASDLNGGTVGLGDKIEYMVTLKNNSGSNISNLMLSDTTSTAMTLDLKSLKCMDQACTDTLEWAETGLSARSHVIKNISVPAGGVRTFRYIMTVNTVSEVGFDIGNNFVEYPSNNNDAYLDILVKPAVNVSGKLTYLYSTGSKTYGKFEVDVSAPVAGEEDGINAGDLINNEAGKLSPEVKSGLDDLINAQNQDSDANGCIDSIGGLVDAANNFAGAVANKVEGALSALRCSGGGCAPIPYNKAFLVPDGPIQGTALFAAGTPNPPFFGFGVSSYVPSSFRLYLSPTLTLGLGTAVCAGPSIGHASPCFAFAIPGGIPGVCQGVNAVGEKVGKYAKKAVSKVKKSLVDTDSGMTTIVSDGSAIQSNAKDVNLGGSWSDPDDPISANVSVNAKIPGFPSVITNWLDNQTDEIYNKLLDFPTFFLILPDFSPWQKSLKRFENSVNANSNSDTPTSVWQGMHDFATTITRLPMVQIEGREIVVKVPAVSPKQIAKYKQQIDNWIKNLEKQLEDRIAVWKCDENEGRKTICDKLTVDTHKLISSARKLLDMLDQIANLPRDILQWRYAQAKYATQIICYLDAIMNYTGGYIKRQQKIADSWLKAAQDAIRTFKDWKIILDVVADYQKSCDACKNDRFSKLNLLLSIFAVVPEPPVIPLPKWPDIVVDFSQIRTGVKIIWPDVVFRPEPIKLPDLPDVKLPEFIPDFELDLGLDGFDFNPPDFSAFTIPDLPELPPLPLPKLPDLPRPPKIPSLNNKVASLAKSLKNIFRLLCLLKKGLIPVPEGTLATEIETLTQPSVQAVLPIIKNLAVQWPAIEYDYVKEVRVTGKLNFNINTNFIYQAAKAGADVWNENLKEVVRKFNTFGTLPGAFIVNILNELDKKSKEAIEKAVDANKDLKEGLDDLQSYDDPIINNIASEMDDIQKELDDYIAGLEVEAVPDKYYLTVTETFLDATHPSLNKSLDQAIADIKIEDLPETPEMQQLVALRGSLIDYARGIYDTNAILEDIDDLESFGKILAEVDQNKIASINLDSSAREGGTLEGSLLGSGLEKMLKEAAESGGRKLAAQIDFDVNDFVQNGGEDDIVPIGLYMTAPDGSVNENVLMYDPALKKKFHLLFSDVDGDNDSDMIYASGGEVYLKENHKQKTNPPKGDLIIGLSNNTVSDFNVEGGDSVQGLIATSVNNKKAELSWKAADGADHYEIILRHSVNDSEEDYAYKIVPELFDEDHPGTTLEIENGYYIATIYSIDSEGNRSLPSDTAIVAPQICADKEPPLPAVTSGTLEVPIFKKLTVDARNSFDPNGELVEYYLETLPYENGDLAVTELPKIIWSDKNVLEDSGGDGVPWNDRSNPVFKVGPFNNEGDVGKHEMLLHVADQSGNSASMKIVVNVIAPDISLDGTFATSLIATGDVDPATSEIPFSLMRKRYMYRVVDGELKLAERLNKVKDSETDESGEYEIPDFNLENMILVESPDGVVVAEIHPDTGNVSIVKQGYSTVAHAASPPDSPTRVNIVNSFGNALGSVYFVADANIDVKIHKQSTFNAENYQSLRGVNVNDVDTEDNFEFFSRPANDPKHPGAAVLTDSAKKEALVIVDTGGGILAVSKDISLSKKKNDHTKDPLVFEIKFKGRVVAEVYVSAGKAMLVGPDDVPYYSPKAPTSGTLYPFDSADSLFETGAGTDLKKILNDLYFSDANLGLGPDDMVKRDQFVRVLLNMLCIIPRPEAYEPGINYSDGEALGEHYAYIKEGTLLGLVEGYKGERDATGLSPYKPENTISRAEAVKIILEALEMKGVVNLSELKEGEPWYNPFMSAAQNLTPYLNEGYFLQNNFIVTPAEAVDPNKMMTFDELIIMVERVLSIYNCFDIDDDNDGMSDFCEAKYNVDDPDLDTDSDGLTNLEECSYGLDPGSGDTDKGGVPDGDEIKMLSNPFNPDDDKPYNDFGGDCIDSALDCKEGENGIYITPAECNTCPCLSTFSYKADAVAGDVFFPIISVDYDDRTHIFSKGNEVTIQSVTSNK